MPEYWIGDAEGRVLGPVSLGPHPVRIEALHQLEERVAVGVDRGVAVEPEDLVGRPALHRAELLPHPGGLLSLGLEQRVR